MRHSKKYNTVTQTLFLSATLFLASHAYAAVPGLSLGSKHNKKTPIEVTSDSLEVMQEQNKAAFTGHVVAVQGKVRLSADKMTVYYASAEDKKNNKKKTDKADSSKDSAAQGAIKKIEAEGNVFLSTPQETASGSVGVYDVQNQEIRLSNQVVLTRGKNILKGDKLTYNFATGRSLISSGAADGGKGGKSGERVRALFVPESSKKNDKSDQ